MSKLTIKASELEEMYEEVLTILGAFSIDVDIEKREVMIVLKRAYQEFQKETSIWQLQNQFGNIYGLPAGQVMSNQIAVFNMNLVTQITDWFASMSRTGGKIPWHKDYIILEPGRQIYDLALESSKPYPPGSRRIHRVMWQGTPELLSGAKFTGGADRLGGDDIINTSAWNFTANGLYYGADRLNYLGQAFDTMLLLQSTEIRRKLLFSEFFYSLSGDMLELFPLPGGQGLNVGPDTKIFYYYFDEKEVIAGRELAEVTNSITSTTKTSEEKIFKKLELTGVQNGVNKVFIVNPKPDPGILVTFNGQTLTVGVDYTLTDNIITFSNDFPPIQSSSIISIYASVTTTTESSLDNNDILLANPAQMKIDLIPWNMLSPWAKTWIWEWTLARCKYIQGAKWRKISKTFSSSENAYVVEFDYNSLISEATDEMKQLKDDLRSDLKELNLVKLMQDKKDIIESARASNKGPRLPFIG